MKIYANRQATKAFLDKFVGKDQWVRVRLPNGYSYIKVLSIEDNGLSVNFREVYDDYVDGDLSIDPGDAKRWVWGPRLYKDQKHAIDVIQIITPIESYTSDELYEILSQHVQHYVDPYYGEDDE